MVEFDMLYLFDNSTATNNTKPYYLDPVLSAYASDEATFNANINIDDYLKTISDVRIMYVNSQTNSQTLKTLLEKNKLNNISIAKTYTQSISSPTTTTTSSSNNSCGSTTQTVPTTNPASPAEIEDNDIILDIAVSNAINKSSLMTHLNNQLSNINASLNTGMSHLKFDEYLSQINAAIAQLFFYAVVYQLNVSANSQYGLISTTTTPGISQDIVDAAKRIQSIAITNIRDLLVPWKFYPFMQYMRDISRKVLTKIAQDIGVSKYADFVKCFSSRASMASDAYKVYYLLFSKMMFDSFFVKNSVFPVVDDIRVDIYMKKMVIELYIKSAYPLIHYDFIDTLMKMYIMKGDFVNSRFGLLAKCMFTYRMIQKIITDASNVPTSLSTQFPTNLLSYLRMANMNNFSSSATTQQKIKEIVTELHKLSNDVNNGSMKTEQLKMAIKDNQLSMRTIIAANKKNMKELNAQSMYFWILVSLILIVITVCGVLFFLQKNDIAIMVAAAILGLILIFKVIMIIIGFIRKN